MSSDQQITVEGGKNLTVPEPLPIKRLRTVSACERAASGPSFKGVIKSFSREQGHGWIATDNDEVVFLHISDIEGNWVPKPGDVVSFKKLLIPPKNEKYQAVHVQYIHLKEGTRECWDD